MFVAWRAFSNCFNWKSFETNLNGKHTTQTITRWHDKKMKEEEEKKTAEQIFINWASNAMLVIFDFETLSFN